MFFLGLLIQSRKGTQLNLSENYSGNVTTAIYIATHDLGNWSKRERDCHVLGLAVSTDVYCFFRPVRYHQLYNRIIRLNIVHTDQCTM